MIDHKAYEAWVLACELPAAEDRKAYEARLRRRRRGRGTAEDARAEAARLWAAEVPTLEGIVAEAEKELGKSLPKGHTRPAIDSREDALYALRLACHVVLSVMGERYAADVKRADIMAILDTVKARGANPSIRLGFGRLMHSIRRAAWQQHGDNGNHERCLAQSNSSNGAHRVDELGQEW